MHKPQIIFVISLLQDLNTVRPIAYLAARETEAEIRFLLTAKFSRRDAAGIWRNEVSELASEISATVDLYEDIGDIFMALQGHQGAIIAGSDSDIARAHFEVAQIFKVAPRGFVRISLQHGLECVGLRQNREHNITFGRNVTFFADVVCSWLPATELSALVASQRAKIWVTGPQMLLSLPRPAHNHPPIAGGIICENLHSPRLNASGNHGQSFMDTFTEYCGVLAATGNMVTLRPHPGGQYVIKNKVELPPNVILNNLPIYKVDLSAYEYGISAPSTVVVDMVLAGLPVAVWRDEAGVMDARMYEGLTAISTLRDWMAFLRDVRLRRSVLVERQMGFLSGLGITLDRDEVYRRFARLLVAAISGNDPVPVVASSTPRPEVPKRVLFFANSDIPSLQQSFKKPLQEDLRRGWIALSYAYGETMKRDLGIKPDLAVESDLEKKCLAAQITTWITRQFDEAMPDLVVACRYSDPGAETITEIAAARNIPVIVHVDDVLLNTPIDNGLEQDDVPAHPASARAVRHLMSEADLIYCSTEPLRRRLREQGFRRPMRAGKICCSGEVMAKAESRVVKRIGYMGFDHADDFQIVVPALVRLMTENPTLEFDLFDSVPMPEEIAVFGDRVHAISPVLEYEEFLTAIAERRWDIGIAPLADTPFNSIKANTKWVEYTCVGAAVIATKGTIYDNCGGDGCALLVGNNGWYDAMSRLVSDPDARYRQVTAAQARLAKDFGVDALRAQVVSMFRTAAENFLNGKLSRTEFAEMVKS